MAQAAAERLRGQIFMPVEDLSLAEQAAAFELSMERTESLDRVYTLLVRSVGLAPRYEMDMAEEDALLRSGLAEAAANTSILLEVATSEVAALEAGVAVLPDDTELPTRLLLAQRRISGLASVLEAELALMRGLEMETDSYTEQVLTSTGELTTGIFNMDVILALLARWTSALMDTVVADGPDLLFKVLLFLVILYVARKLAGFLSRTAERAIKKSNLKLSQLLQRMVLTVIRNLVMAIGILVALSQVGVSLGPLLAGLGVVGFVIGFALQDTDWEVTRAVKMTFDAHGISIPFPQRDVHLFNEAKQA